MNFIIYDSGKSMLTTNDNAIPIPIVLADTDDFTQMFLLAEFGLAVASGSTSNYVELSGTIGVQTAGPQNAVIKILITQRNTNDDNEEIIYMSKDTIIADGNGVIPFDTIVSNSNNHLPGGYYAYRLYIVNIVGILPFPSAIVSGPFIFKGVSYEQETANNNSGDTIFNLDVIGTGNIVDFTTTSNDTISGGGSSGGNPNSGSTTVNINVNGNYNTVTFNIVETTTITA